MAYGVTSRAATLIKTVGVNTAPFMSTGVVALSGGVATVTIRGARRIIAAIPAAQSTNAVSVSATTANTFSLAGTSSDVVMWICTWE